LKTEFQMAMILITHDVGLVAGLVDRVSVMYGGRIVEDGDVLDVFDGPAHPYTRGLLGSVPRLDRPAASLVPIPGSPKDVYADQVGCPYVDRCPFAMDVCASEFPPRFVLRPDHHANCWLLADVSAPPRAEASRG